VSCNICNTVVFAVCCCSLSSLCSGAFTGVNCGKAEKVQTYHIDAKSLYGPPVGCRAIVKIAIILAGFQIIMTINIPVLGGAGILLILSVLGAMAAFIILKWIWTFFMGGY
jgi:hypothetical protein